MNIKNIRSVLLLLIDIFMDISFKIAIYLTGIFMLLTILVVLNLEGIISFSPYYDLGFVMRLWFALAIIVISICYFGVCWFGREEK